MTAGMESRLPDLAARFANRNEQRVAGAPRCPSDDDVPLPVLTIPESSHPLHTHDVVARIDVQDFARYAGAQLAQQEHRRAADFLL